MESKEAKSTAKYSIFQGKKKTGGSWGGGDHIYIYIYIYKYMQKQQLPSWMPATFCTRYLFWGVTSKVLASALWSQGYQGLEFRASGSGTPPPPPPPPAQVSRGCSLVARGPLTCSSLGRSRRQRRIPAARSGHEEKAVKRAGRLPR